MGLMPPVTPSPMGAEQDTRIGGQTHLGPAPSCALHRRREREREGGEEERERERERGRERKRGKGAKRSERYGRERKMREN